MEPQDAEARKKAAQFILRPRPGFERAPGEDAAGADESAAAVARDEAGYRMPDGSVYVGLSPETGRPLFAAGRDAPLTMDFNQAAAYARGLEAHGHDDWRLPSQAELDLLYRRRDQGALRDSFNTSGAFVEGWYWSAAEGKKNGAYGQRFSDGSQSFYYKGHGSAVRCVRG